MPFEPRIDHDRLSPLLDHLEVERQELLALDVPPMLERWLQRVTEARGAHMSTRIEGNPMTEAEVREAFARDVRRSDAAELENLNYRDAVRFARQYADDAGADVDGGLIRALHFLIVREVDRHGTAGQYRTQQNAVMRGRDVVYMPPPPTQVRRLMDDLVQWLRASRGTIHPLVLGAVAHLELASIHPFDDGNGRTARAITAYFLARGGWRLREFVSVEQVFGEDPEGYYAELQRVQGARYPGSQTELTGWTAWFLITLRMEVVARGGTAIGWYAALQQSVSALHLPARLGDGLAFVSLAGRVSRSEYAEALDVSAATAVADLSKLMAAGLVERQGRGRATRYASLVKPPEEFVPDARLDALRMMAQQWSGTSPDSPPGP